MSTPTTTLFVKNIPFDLIEQELGALFAGVAHVIKATIATDRFSGQSRGFGFVEIDICDDLQHVIRKTDGMTVGGRKIHVEEAHTPRSSNRPLLQ